MQTAWQDPFTWPLLVFLLSCCVYPLASSCAHTFSTMSARARHICFFFDYAALSFYSLGSAVVYSAYVFPDRWVGGVFHRGFVLVSVVNTVVCTVLACYSRLGLPFLQYDHGVVKKFPDCQSPKFSKTLRVAAFAFPYLFDSIPLFFRLFVCEGDDCTDNDANALHCYHISLAFLTAFLFATHLPERLAPGSFDYIGHSHQLFHVCGVLGTHFQMAAVEQDMAARRRWLSQNSVPVTFSSSLGPALACMLINLTVVGLFSLPLLSASVCTKKKLRQGQRSSD